LIHTDKDLSRDHGNKGQDLSKQQQKTQATYHMFKESSVTCVLLATPQIKVKDCKGNFQTCHALLDCGSQSNFIMDSLIRRLGLEQTRNQVPIMGINNAKSVTNYNVNLEITAMNNGYTRKLNCLVLLCHVRHKYTGCKPFCITSRDAQSENLFFPTAPISLTDLS
jgi:hypothetical protein